MPSVLVVIPTYNRSGLLRKALLSLLQARHPAGLDIAILVVDNNSRDDTHAVVDEISSTAPVPVRYFFEVRQSLSCARNAGIRACHSDLLAFIDDDEEVEPHWFEVILREFTDPATQFIGGPYFAGASLTLPDWLPPDYPAVIGIHRPRPRAALDAAFTGNLNGGNAVFRRSVFDRVGLYSTELGRSGKGLLSEEDAELFRRIVAANLHGIFVPDLIIFHHVPPERLTPRYHRRWCFWRGVSQGILARKAQQEPVPHLLGVPRYRLGRALRTLTHLVAHPTPTLSSQRLNSELSLWDLAGFVYGRFFIRVERIYQPVKQS